MRGGVSLDQLTGVLKTGTKSLEIMLSGEPIDCETARSLGDGGPASHRLGATKGGIALSRVTSLQAKLVDRIALCPYHQHIALGQLT